MSSVVTMSCQKSNQVGAEVVTQNERDGGLNAAIIRRARTIFPQKTWLFLADLFEVSERTAKHRLAGSREFSAADIADLLRTERGLVLLTTLMGEARPKWWVDFQQHRAVVDARRFERVARRRLQDAIDARNEIAGAIESADAAMAVCDEEFFEPQIAARKSAAGVSHRTLAETTKGRR